MAPGDFWQELTRWPELPLAVGMCNSRQSFASAGTVRSSTRGDAVDLSDMAPCGLPGLWVADGLGLTVLSKTGSPVGSPCRPRTTTLGVTEGDTGGESSANMDSGANDIMGFSPLLAPPVLRAPQDTAPPMARTGNTDGEMARSAAR